VGATSSGLVSAIWFGWAKAFGMRRSARNFGSHNVGASRGETGLSGALGLWEVADIYITGLIYIKLV
jgi:hypothetical protein